MRRAALAFAIAWVAPLAVAGPAPAATFSVGATADVAGVAPLNDGVCDSVAGPPSACTLRAAVQEANGTPGPDTIQLPDLGTAYGLSLGGAGEDFAAGRDLDVRADLTIIGSGEPVVSGLGADRVLHVGPGATNPALALTGVQVRDGGGVDRGGGIYADSGGVSLNQVTVSDNEAESASGTALGAGVLFDGGSHSVVASTIANNSAAAQGSASGGGLAVAAGTGVAVTNSTISLNDAVSAADAALGGGIFNIGAIVLTQTTLDTNSAAGAGGASGGTLMTLGTASLRATIASNGDADPGSENCSGPIATQGSNLEAPATGGSSQCGLLTAVGDRLSPSAGLAALAARGGPTQTHALFSGSPALEAIPSCFPVTVDQRGEPRPGGVACEIGAYERQELPPPGSGCFGKSPTILGKPGVSRIVGSPQPDVILGAGGKERITGGGGKDLICGGKGNDRILGGASHDRLAGQDGKDRLFGEAGKDHLLGNAGRDVLDGGAGPDLLNGGGRRDACRSGRGDTLKGC